MLFIITTCSPLTEFKMTNVKVYSDNEVSKFACLNFENSNTNFYISTMFDLNSTKSSVPYVKSGKQHHVYDALKKTRKCVCVCLFGPGVNGSQGNIIT